VYQGEKKAIGRRRTGWEIFNTQKIFSSNISFLSMEAEIGLWKKDSISEKGNSRRVGGKRKAVIIQKI